MKLTTEALLDEYRKYCLGVRSIRMSSARAYVLKVRGFIGWLKDRAIENDGTVPVAVMDSRLRGNDGHAKRHQDDGKTEIDAKGLVDEVLETTIGDYIISLKERNLSINSQRMTITALKMFFRWYRTAYGKADPTVNIVAMREYIKHPDILRVEEVERMINEAGKDNFTKLRNAAILCVLADTGIRISELLALKVGNIQMEDRQFIMSVPATKSYRTRSIPFCYRQEGNLVAETFAFYWLQVKVVLQWKANDYLFQRETHCQRRHGDGWIDGALHPWEPGALSKMAVNNMIKKVTKAAKVERKVSAHSFRHFYATYLAVKGLDIIKIQTRLGHASLNRTMIYIHYSELVKEDSAKDNPLSGAKTNWTGAVKAWVQMVENEKHKR